MTSPTQSKPEQTPPRVSLSDLYGQRPARPRLKTGVSATTGWAALLESRTSAHRDQG